MKKTTMALIISAIAGTSMMVQATPDEGIYLGADVGYSKSTKAGIGTHGGNNNRIFNNDFKEFQEVKGNDVSYGIYAGYKFNPYLAAEMSVDYFGKIKIKHKDIPANQQDIKDYGKNSHKITMWGGTVSAKGIYPITDALDIYARAGIAIVDAKLKISGDQHHTAYFLDNVNEPSKKYKSVSTTKVAPMVGVGLEYALTDNLSLKAEYRYIHRVKLSKFTNLFNDTYKNDLGKRDVVDIKPSIHTANLGLTYYFSKAPIITSKKYAFSSDVLFDFGKSNLKAGENKHLNQVVSESAGLNNTKVSVAGYTDRIGSEAYNLKLSQQRAETVAGYLSNKGVANISAVGYGKANPVTNAACDNVKGRNALIKCLAPDRRVEINVTGNK